ncbi:hypothetical protein ACE3NQ_12320 [Paenibacillus terreus]|uniref:Uncharacterized protein n=1 Tax=Paenibacillus terreus TaxID=1387834 RepID=A0ABV5B816_9BACL
MDKFKRGYVAWGTIPEVIHTTETPRPGFFLTGKHLYIALHDYDFPDIRPESVLVVPNNSTFAEPKST